VSFTLIAWKLPAVKTEDEAIEVVRKFYASDSVGNLDVFEPSDDVLRFYDELMAHHTALGVHGDEKLRFETPERSDRVIELDLPWSTPDAELETIVRLARKHDLVLYDPQGPTLHSPAEGGQTVDTGAELRSALRGGIAGAVVAVAGFYVPLRFLGWLMTAAGGFVAVMAVYTLMVLRKPDPDCR
jgi:hypothetical protein